MQIILVQAEIEQAIRNYVNDQVNIKDGMSILIDLRSTRGAEGFTANIDIMKDGVTTTQAVKIPEGLINRQVMPEKELEATKSVAAKAVTETQETTTEPTKETEAPIKKSLFGNLKKPVNEPTSVE